MIPAWWHGGRGGSEASNWGDILTPFLIKAIGGQQAVRSKGGGGRCLAAGSIMHRMVAGDVIWGTGALDERHVPAKIPAGVRFCAVRGPLVRRVLLDRGASVPEVFGDPGLLMGHLMRAKKQTILHRVGLVPHWVDTDAVRHLDGRDGIHLIDIRAGLAEVVREVAACERILSSSLHGLVAGDAYGKEIAWLKVEGCKRLVGGEWKFKDYLASTGRAPVGVALTGSTLPGFSWLPPPKIDLDALLRACPFNGGKYSRVSELRTMEV